jgi:transposase
MDHYELGIDVSQLLLEMQALDGTKKLYQASVKNSIEGFQKTHHWFQKRGIAPEQVHVCLEATGHYGDAVAIYFQELGYQVSVVNPAYIKAFANAIGNRQKTDQVDAGLIARYCQLHTPDLWEPLSPEIVELRTQVRRIAALEKMRQQERNRLSALLPSHAVRDSIQRHIDYLDQEIAAFKRQVETYLKKDATLRPVRDLLVSIPGVGDLTAARLIAEIGHVSRFESREQLVAFFGLEPVHYESGTSVRQPSHISKKGNALLRAALYFPAISAKNHNPVIRAFCQRLEQRGIKPKAQVVAAMRKLLLLVYAIWKSGKPFDPNFLAQRA